MPKQTFVINTNAPELKALNGSEVNAQSDKISTKVSTTFEVAKSKDEVFTKETSSKCDTKVMNATKQTVNSQSETGFLHSDDIFDLTADEAQTKEEDSENVPMYNTI